MSGHRLQEEVRCNSLLSDLFIVVFSVCKLAFAPMKFQQEGDVCGITAMSFKFPSVNCFEALLGDIDVYNLC